MGLNLKKLLTSTKIAPWALIGGVALGTFGAVQARADSTDELLELLKRKGAITKKEYAVIKARHVAEKQSGAGQYVTGEAGPPPRYVTALDKGIGIRLPLPGIGVGVVKGAVPEASFIDVTISGNVNAFYVQQRGEVTRGIGRRSTVAGGIPDASKSTSGIRSGLLPTAIVLDIATKQEGFDISGTLGFYTGISSVNQGLLGINAIGPGYTKAFGSPSIDVKLAYAKVGTNGYGTFEFGRDFALFGQDILTYDQNELALGVPGNNIAQSNNTFGQIGFGYQVQAFTPQFRYSTPNYRGFDVTFTVEQANDATSFGAIGATSGGSIGIAGPGGLLNPSSTFAKNQPRVAARLKYTGNLLPNAMFTAWATGVTQEAFNLRAGILNPATGTFANGALLPGGKNNNRVYGAEAGGKLDVGPAELLGYGYYGKGIGTTALLFDGFDNRGDPRNSYGFLAQASYTFFDRLTFAGGVGVSWLEHTNFDARPGQLLGGYGGAGTINNVKLNEAAIGTVRYKVTKWLNLVGQYAHSRSKAISGAKIDADAAIGGAQIFF